MVDHVVSVDWRPESADMTWMEEPSLPSQFQKNFDLSLRSQSTLAEVNNQLVHEIIVMNEVSRHDVSQLVCICDIL